MTRTAVRRPSREEYQRLSRAAGEFDIRQTQPEGFPHGVTSQQLHELCRLCCNFGQPANIGVMLTLATEAGAELMMVEVHEFIPDLVGLGMSVALLPLSPDRSAVFHLWLDNGMGVVVDKNLAKTETLDSWIAALNDQLRKQGLIKDGIYQDCPLENMIQSTTYTPTNNGEGQIEIHFYCPPREEDFKLLFTLDSPVMDILHKHNYLQGETTKIKNEFRLSGGEEEPKLDSRGEKVFPYIIDIIRKV